MKIDDAIRKLDVLVPNPTSGLPDKIFYYVSRTTPLINVDLLIQDKNKRTLFAWRSDDHAGKGWHIPGGVIRYRETIADRIKEVARREVGTSKITFDSKPLTVNEIIVKEKRDRAHFISLLYNCKIDQSFILNNKDLTQNDPGYLKWFETCPDDLLTWHEIYVELFNN